MERQTNRIVQGITSHDWLHRECSRQQQHGRHKQLVSDQCCNSLTSCRTGCDKPTRGKQPLGKLSIGSVGCMSTSAESARQGSLAIASQQQWSWWCAMVCTIVRGGGALQCAGVPWCAPLFTPFRWALLPRARAHSLVTYNHSRKLLAFGSALDINS